MRFVRSRMRSVLFGRVGLSGKRAQRFIFNNGVISMAGSSNGIQTLLQIGMRHKF